jgi:3-oxoadipate enol-lactonase
MPTIKTDDGCPIHVEVAGSEGQPALMLSNSLGTNLHMWDDQAPEFAKHFRLIRYDRRGHGGSVLDALKIAKTNWCWLSMGGMVGQWLGANAPDRVEKLILSNCTDYYPDKGPWNDRIKTITEKGLGHIVSANMERWFTKGFRDKHPEVIARFTEMFLATKLDGYIACGMAVRDMDHRALLPKIKAPTLIIAGRQDAATTLAMAESMRERIPGAKVAVMDAAHISNAEQPQAYTETVLNFLL